MSNHRKNSIFTGVITVVIGLMIPFVVKITINLLSINTGAINKTIKFFFEGNMLFNIGFWVVYYGVPFTLLALLAKGKIKITKKSNTSNVPSGQFIFSIISAYVFVFSFSLCINIIVAISKSSTASIAYLFIPFYETITIIVGYFMGWLVYKIFLWLKLVKM